MWKESLSDIAPVDNWALMMGILLSYKMAVGARHCLLCHMQVNSLNPPISQMGQLRQRSQMILHVSQLDSSKGWIWTQASNSRAQAFSLCTTLHPCLLLKEELLCFNDTFIPSPSFPFSLLEVGRILLWSSGWPETWDFSCLRLPHAGITDVVPPYHTWHTHTLSFSFS